MVHTNNHIFHFYLSFGRIDGHLFWALSDIYMQGWVFWINYVLL